MFISVDFPELRRKFPGVVQFFRHPKLNRDFLSVVNSSINFTKYADIIHIVFYQIRH